MEKTYFIAFEGIDGAGKDTQLNKLVEAIKEDNNSKPFGNKYSRIWITREPTKMTDAGITIANLIRQRDVSGEEATRYYVEDRKQHTKIIKDMLKHSHVLTSRYDLSTLSYQMTQGMDFDYLYELHQYNQENGCIIPDITLIFDIDADTAFNRMGGRNSTHECFEKIEFQRELRKNLLWIIDELRKRDGRKIIVVNADQPIKDVTKEMIDKIEETISNKVE